MKKGLIKEYLSKIMYDRNEDPINYDIIFKDSDVFRRVPFSFLYFKLDEGGFEYRGNFYPLYKIVGIVNNKSKKFLLKREFEYNKIRYDPGPEYPEFPILFRNVYQPQTIIRYASEMISYIEEKIKEEPGDWDKWFACLGKFDRIDFEGFQIYIIKDEGIFKGVKAIFHEESFLGILRGFYDPVKLSEFKSVLQFQRIYVYKINFNLIEVIKLKNFILAIKEDRVFPIEKDVIEKIRKLPEDLLILLQRGHTKYLLVGISDALFKIFLDPFREKNISMRLSIPVLPAIQGNILWQEAQWIDFEGHLLKIHDWDVIFSTNK